MQTDKQTEMTFLKAFTSFTVCKKLTITQTTRVNIMYNIIKCNNIVNFRNLPAL
jgi:hypothetical protein